METTHSDDDQLCDPLSEYDATSNRPDCVILSALMATVLTAGTLAEYLHVPAHNDQKSRITIMDKARAAFSKIFSGKE